MNKVFYYFEQFVTKNGTLIFIPRCTDSKDKHLIYVALKEDEFPPLDHPTIALEGDDNIVSFDDINVNINSGVEYKWRVDCLEALTEHRRMGDTWVFTIN